MNQGPSLTDLMGFTRAGEVVEHARTDYIKLVSQGMVSRHFLVFALNEG